MDDGLSESKFGLLNEALKGFLKITGRSNGAVLFDK